MIKKTLKILILLLALSIIFILINNNFYKDLDKLVTNDSSKRSIENYNLECSSDEVTLSFDTFSGVLPLIEIDLSNKDDFKIIYNSKILSKNCYFYLMDDEFNIISKFDINEKDSKIISPDKNKYYLKLASSSSKDGSADIKFYSNSNLTIAKTSFWSNKI